MGRCCGGRLPPFVVRSAATACRGDRPQNKRKRGVGSGDLGGGTGGPIYRAGERRGPSDRGSAGAADSRDAYAGRTPTDSPFGASWVYLKEKNGKKILRRDLSSIVLFIYICYCNISHHSFNGCGKRVLLRLSPYNFFSEKKGRGKP